MERVRQYCKSDSCDFLVFINADALHKIAQIAAIRCLTEWGVSNKIPAHGSVHCSGIAMHLDADPAVITRLAGILVASGILQQVGGDSLAHTARSRIYANDKRSGKLFQLVYDEAIKPCAHLHEYLTKHGVREPSYATVNPHTFAHGREGTSYFDIIVDDPK